jgi:hypothetical protein
MAAKKAGCFGTILYTVFTSLLAPLLVHFIIEQLHTAPNQNWASGQRQNPPVHVSQGGWDRPWAEVEGDPLSRK